MIITQDGIVALPRTPDGDIMPNNHPWSCVYVQIESVKPRPSQLPGHFGILLSFYNREADATKVELVEFDCKEPLDQNDDGEERK